MSPQGPRPGRRLPLTREADDATLVQASSCCHPGREEELDASRTDDTRGRILEAAFALFAEKGFSGTTTREIAELASVNEVTIFRHFRSKEALFQAGVEQHSPGSVLAGELREELGADVRESLRHLAARYLSAALPSAQLIHLGMTDADRDPELREVVAQMPQRLQRRLSEHLGHLQRRGRVRPRDFDLVAQLFYGMLLQHVLAASGLPACARRPDVPAGMVADTVADLFWSYLRPDGEHDPDPAAPGAGAPML